MRRLDGSCTNDELFAYFNVEFFASAIKRHFHSAILRQLYGGAASLQHQFKVIFLGLIIEIGLRCAVPDAV